MQTVTLAEAKSKLSRLIEMVKAGEEVTITVRGRPAVRLVAPESVRQQLPSLAGLRARLPEQTEPAGTFLRQMRDSDRY